MDKKKLDIVFNCIHDYLCRQNFFSEVRKIMNILRNNIIS
jgi:hypothetical protein